MNKEQRESLIHHALTNFIADFGEGIVFETVNLVQVMFLISDFSDYQLSSSDKLRKW